MTNHQRMAMAWDFYSNDPFLKKYRLDRYACNPLVPAIQLEEGVFCFPHFSPDRIAASNSYLVCGEEAAMLIDTAYGIGDLHALCCELTDLPIIVVNTHNHYDHTGGNSRFGSCFMHILDAGKPEMLRKPQALTLLSKNPDTFYTEEDIAAPGLGEIHPIESGHVFDLGGGYELEIIRLAGHTSGSIAIMDRKRGILFTGDAIMSQPCSTLIVNFAGTAADSEATVEAFFENLVLLLPRTGSINYLCPGHCAIQTEPSLIQDAYDCCRDILNDPCIGGAARFRQGAKMHIRGGISITYTESHIYK